MRYRSRAEESATDLFNAYKEWCADANETAGTQKVFGGKLGERGFERKRKEHGTVYFGIRLVRPRLNHAEKMNHPEPKSGIDSPASVSRYATQKNVQEGSEGSAEEVRAVAETIKELYNEDDTQRFADNRELHRTLLFRHLIPEEVTIATLKAAREILA